MTQKKEITPVEQFNSDPFQDIAGKAGMILVVVLVAVLFSSSGCNLKDSSFFTPEAGIIPDYGMMMPVPPPASLMPGRFMFIYPAVQANSPGNTCGVVINEPFMSEANIQIGPQIRPYVYSFETTFLSVPEHPVKGEYDEETGEAAGITPERAVVAEGTEVTEEHRLTCQEIIPGAGQQQITCTGRSTIRFYFLEQNQSCEFTYDPLVANRVEMVNF